MKEAISGVVCSLVIIILSQLLSRLFSRKLIAATILVAIAFIYAGFSLQTNSVSSIILEVGAALVFYFLAIIGYTRNNKLIAYGIIFHGVWDIFHHKGFLIGTKIPEYWPSFCFVVDIITGVYFLFVFNMQKKIPEIPGPPVM